MDRAKVDAARTCLLTLSYKLYEAYYIRLDDEGREYADLKHIEDWKRELARILSEADAYLEAATSRS